MRRFLAITMAVLLGLLTAIVTNSTLNKPMWRHSPGIPGNSGTLGFVHNGRAFLTVEGYDPAVSGLDRPRISWWDTETGSQLKSVELDIPSNYRWIGAFLGADDVSLEVSATRSKVLDNQAEITVWIADLETGRRRFALPQQDFPFGPINFSTDGRWCSYVRGRTNIAILSAMTGEDVLVIEVPEARYVTDVMFLPGGSQTAVLSVAKWGNGNLSTQEMTLEFFEIPGGRSTIRRPLQGIWSISGCHDDRIRLEKTLEFKSIPGSWDWRRQVVSWHIGNDELDDERDEGEFDGSMSFNESLFVQFKHDLGVRWASGDAKSGLRSKYRRLMKSAFPSAQFNSPDDGNVELRLFDIESGRTYADFSDFPGKSAVSSDGQRIGCISSDGYVEMWDGTPPPRWPWVTAAGLAMAAAAWFVTRKLLPTSKPRQVPEFIPDCDLF